MLEIGCFKIYTGLFGDDVLFGFPCSSSYIDQAFRILKVGPGRVGYGAWQP